MSKSPLLDAKSKLVFNYTFFGSLALYLVEKETRAIPTAATDGRHLFYNPDWFNSLSEEHQLSVIAHEVMHPALGHVYKWRRGTRQHANWNIAGDHVIDLMLKSAGMSIPKDWCKDEKYEGWNTEEVYSTLPKPDPNCKTCNGRGVVKKQDPSDQQGQQQGKGKDEKGQKGGSGSPGKGDPSQQGQQGQPGGGGTEVPPQFDPCPDCGGKAPGGIGFDIIEDVDGTSEEEQKRAKQWTERLIGAAQVAKQRGTLPAGIERLLDDLLNPKLPWHIILSHLVAEVTRDDYDDTRYDRRFITQGWYFPDIYMEKVYAAVAVDTSGSIGADELSDFLSETWGLLNSRAVNRIRLMSCDADVHYDQDFQPYDAPPKSIPGGGGTDFIPVFDRIAEGPDRPACLIYFTDMYGSFPDERPEYPVFWVTKSKDVEAPFGQVIDFN